MTPKIIEVDERKPIPSTVAELQLAARALIIVLGAFESKWNDQVRSICSRVIVPVALDPGALILDDARSSGCARLLAEAALEHDRMATLLGVVPSDRPEVEIDGDHSVVLRLAAAWSDYAKYTFQIADELVSLSNVAAKAAGDGTGSTKPVVALLFGGGEVEKKALIRCARRGWPVFLVAGTGGITDEILTARGPGENGSRPNVMDPELREIVETARIYPTSIDAKAEELQQVLCGRIEGQREAGEGILKQAWLRFDELDINAGRQQSRFRRVELALITLAMLAAFFAILTTGSAVPVSVREWAHLHGLPFGTLRLLVTLTPIALSLIAGYNSHSRDGTKWILLRGAAEALKREIYQFRAKAGTYSEEQCWETSPELKLATKLKDITFALEQSEVNKESLVTPAVSKEERTTFLSPEEYIECRLRDQVRHYASKTAGLARRLRVLQCLIYMAGAAGTLLAAMRLDIWVALATSLVTALTTKLQTDQVENSLTQYNQALANLQNVDAWWNALTKWEKSRRKNIDVLVEQTERTLETETTSWIQQMQSGLDKLTEKEPRR